MIEIGRWSAVVSGFKIFGIGSIEAAFHCLGTTEVDSGRLNLSAIGVAKNRAPTLTGRKIVETVAVGRNASSILKTVLSMMSSETCRVFTEHLDCGAMYLASVDISA